MHRRLYKPQSETSVNDTLADLPTEILLLIFKYLDPIFLFKTITLVCKRFTSILLDEDYWKFEYFELLKSYHKFDEVPVLARLGLFRESGRWEPNVQWRDMTVRLKSIHNRWKDPENMSKFHSSTETVDTVHILDHENICITGSRERCIDLWGIESFPYIRASIIDAHRGWVTSLDSFEKGYFLSGAWDSTVTYWNIGESICQPVWTFNCGRGVMAAIGRRGLVAAATFSPSIFLIDPRIQIKHKSSRYTLHDKPLVNMVFWNDNIISVGRDQQLALFDLRNLSVVHKIQISRIGGVPRSLAIRDGIIYVGDTRGCVHLFHASNNITKFQQVPVASKNDQIAAVCPDLGMFLAGSTDRTLRVIVPSKPVYEMKVLDVEHEITSMSYRNKILAIGKTNGAVDIFRPS